MPLPVWAIPAAIGAASGGGAMALFGGKKDKLDPYGQLNPEQRSVTKTLGPYLNSMIGQAAPQYTGSYVAPFGQNEQDILSRNARLGALGGQGFENLLSGEFPEDYYQKAIYRPMMKQYQEDIQPQIEEQYAGSGGYWGGARAGAVARGYRDLQDTLAAERAKLGYQARRDVMDAAPAYSQFEGANMQLQGLPRMAQQYGLDKQYEEFVRTRPERLPYLNAALDFLGVRTGTLTKGESGLQRFNDFMAAGSNALTLLSGIQGLKATTTP